MTRIANARVVRAAEALRVPAPHLALAHEQVHLLQHALAVLTQAQALDALERLLARGRARRRAQVGPAAEQDLLERGDVDAGLARSTQVFSGELSFAGQEHFYLETQACLAHVDENEQIFIQSSTQHPTETQDIVSHVLGIPAHEVTVQCLRMGGGFGGKEMQPHGYAALAALGATLTGRPVRLRLNRTLDITMTGKQD